MKILSAKTGVLFSLISLAVFSLPLQANENQAKNMSQLLQQVRSGRIAEGRENRQREAEFAKDLKQQARLLAQVKAERRKQEQLSTQLEKQFEKNDELLAAAEKRLKERMGSLSELFGHITSSAGDARGNFSQSLINLHYPERVARLDALIEVASSGVTLPAIEDIEAFWFELQREMTESGRIVKFDTIVINPDGEQAKQSVARIGSFNVISADGEYLSYNTKNQVLEVLGRQPSSRYIDQAKTLAASSSGVSPFGIDPTGPSGGSYLAALINSPTLLERWHQGGKVGYVITVVGAVALLIALWRILTLLLVGAKVNAQLKSSTPNTNNPLGRVLTVAEENKSGDLENLELKLGEAVLKELPKLESGLAILKIIAAVAPLLGLLGTVTGMILTFQAITIFGSGDPKAMAGGISSALVTTVLGLLVAIPTVLLHTWVSGMSKKQVHILEEQSAGIIAQHHEAQ